MLLFNYLSFTNIAKNYNGISVFIDDKEVSCGDIHDVLEELSSLENGNDIPYYQIVDTAKYFDLFVIKLSSNKE